MRTRCLTAIVVTIGLTMVLAPAPAPHAQESPILTAMRDELQRSMSDLRMKGEPPPYYIAYQLDDTSSMRVLATLGAIVEDSSSRDRTLRVEVRVGDYTFDSSRFLSFDRADADVTATLDDDVVALRRQLWLATDAAYKRAVNVFARKKAAFQNRAPTEAIPDFSHETAAETVLPLTAPPGANREWADRVRQISAVFGSTPDIQASEVSISETRGTRYYLNSEGFKVVAPIQSASLRVAAEAQSDDGMVVRQSFSVVEKSLEDLPPLSGVVGRGREVAERLTAERTAPIGEEYTGPVMIEGEASAALLAQTLAPLMLARRAPDSDNTRRTMMAQAQVTPFLARIGLRVLPDAFSVTDTPSLEAYNNQPVPGAYAVDDEGVVAKDVTLVQNGRLLTLLTSRTPQKNLLQSNGHGRGGVPQAGVFQVRSAQAIPLADLKEKYLEVLKAQDKPFGYIVRAIAQEFGGEDGPAILQLAKVTPDGQEQVVRGLRFGNIPPSTFRDILEASEERTLFSYRSFTGAGGGAIVSAIVPSLIFEELEIQRIKDIGQKPPIVPSPLKE